MPQDFRFANIKVKSNNIEETIQFLNKKWEKLDPVHHFKYKFYNDQIQEYFAIANNMVRGFSLIAFLAIFIAFFGLLGMVIYGLPELGWIELSVFVLNASNQDNIILTDIMNYMSYYGAEYLYDVKIDWWIVGNPTNVSIDNVTLSRGRLKIKEQF